MFAFVTVMTMAAVLIAPAIGVDAIAIPLTSATASHSGSYGAAYGSHASYGASPYKMSKGYNPYSSALTSSSMHSSSPYTSPYSSPYTSGYTSPYSYGSMSPYSYYDQMPAYETAIDVHGAGFY